MSDATAQHLAHKYGTDAEDLLRIAAEGTGLRVPLVGNAAPLAAEVVYAVRAEMALTVEDVLARRIGLELYDWRLAMDSAPLVARLMGRELGWGAADAARAAGEYSARIARRLEAAGLTASPVAQATS
jgi:glycerol-3-phosphate dehydrogenase